jgi:3-methyladenine DNA glycosylase AlkD
MISKKLRTIFEPLRNPEVASWQTNYMKQKFVFLGIRIPMVRQKVKELKDSSQNWRDEVKELWEQKEREFHHAALFWAIHYLKKAEAHDIELFEELIVTNSWWDTVDTVAPHLAGWLIQRFPELIIKTEEWVKSDNLWLKRASLIFQLPLKEKTDKERLFLYCKKLANEKDFFIRKAIGWSLRTYSKTNPEAIRNFLKEASLSPLSIKEAKKHLK